jgi:hypothetical protein
MSASLCYWLGIGAGAAAVAITVVMGLLIRFSCAPDPSEEYQIARIQEWTVDESELGDWTFPDSQRAA